MTHPFCTETYSTKRNVDFGNNLRGAPVTYLTGLLGTPLWSLRPETIETLGISSPREFKEIFIVPSDEATLPDIIEGDVLVHGGSEYRIDHVAEWPDIAGGIPTLHIVVTAIKLAWATVEVAP